MKPLPTCAAAFLAISLLTTQAAIATDTCSPAFHKFMIAMDALDVARDGLTKVYPLGPVTPNESRQITETIRTMRKLGNGAFDMVVRECPAMQGGPGATKITKTRTAFDRLMGATELEAASHGVTEF